MSDARAIANLVLDRASETGRSVTNMHLNKILFYLWGEHYKKYNQELFQDKFEAWNHGPVISEIYHQFKSFSDKFITSRATRRDFVNGVNLVVEHRLDGEVLVFLTERIDLYLRVGASRLREWSHVEGGPWWNAWNGHFSANPGMTIPFEEIRSYFGREWPYGGTFGTA